MNIRLNGTVSDSIVDGPGLRLAVFTQGCPHRCPGCHNPGTHDPAGGYEADTAAVLADLKENPLLDGLTLSGGEPFAQPEACL
ncbi:MAG: 4Fe-4S cluster-binding domain-containing protein, partial [Clostridiales bacterium]|nr:4Fe-4S cluster-binding domain-containing protein [Clostridiales bacterium]